MLTNSGAFAEFHESHVDVLTEFAQVQFAAFERLSVLNFKITREAIGEGSAYAKALLAAKDTPELSRLSVALALPALDRTLAYSLGVGEIGSQAQGEMARLAGAEMTEFSNSMAEGLVKLARYAPVGFGMAAKAAKSVLQTAESALDSLAASGVEVEASEAAHPKPAAVTATIGPANAKSAKAGVKTGRRIGGTGKGGARTRKSARRKAA